MTKPLIINDLSLLKQLGEHLREKREAIGSSTEQMAERCSLTENDITAIEAGESDLEQSLLLSLIEAYGLSAEEWLSSLVNVPTDSVDIDALKQSFLGINSPNRGKMFKDFISQLPKE